MTLHPPAQGNDAAFTLSRERRSTVRVRPTTARAQVGSVALARSTAFGGITALKGGAFETRLQPHVHSSYVIGVVDDGAVEVTVNGVSAIATAGSVIVISPFVVHTEIPLAPGGWSFRYLYPNESAVREILGDSPRYRAALPFPCPVLADPGLASAIRNLDDDLRATGDRAVTESRFAEIVRAAAAHSHTSAHAPRERRNVQAVRTLITQRTQRNVSLGDLAAAAGLSPFHFLRVFKAEVGLPPYAYFEQVRIAYANEMLCAGVEPSEVAYLLGFTDQSHLNRQFGRGSFTTPGRLSRLASQALDHARSTRARR
ncbi:MAG: helix-turn-helix domain-containing protein [Cytophagaceae bacterium]|nr:helix-turn-helix domain-containing protein [Gemmatimonadaceae bacterium]